MSCGAWRDTLLSGAAASLAYGLKQFLSVPRGVFSLPALSLGFLSVPLPCRVPANPACSLGTEAQDWGLVSALVSLLFRVSTPGLAVQQDPGSCWLYQDHK